MNGMLETVFTGNLTEEVQVRKYKGAVSTRFVAKGSELNILPFKLRGRR
ncbi:hypothetical protein [Pseudogulbenkiania sp. MAI-1]|nr:hypothetical protein [Pseudogulbenkiania sp. MAI-1]